VQNLVLLVVVIRITLYLEVWRMLMNWTFFFTVFAARTVVPPAV
jgi:hypothetical protein